MEAKKLLLALSTEGANVLLMQIKFNRISIDVLYARLSLRTLLEDMDILDEKCPENLDDTVKSLNVCRVIAWDKVVNGLKILPEVTVITYDNVPEICLLILPLPLHIKPISKYVMGWSLLMILCTCQ